MGREKQQYSQYRPVAYRRGTGTDIRSDNAQYYQPPPNGAYGAQYGAPQYGHYAPQYVLLLTFRVMVQPTAADPDHRPRPVCSPIGASDYIHMSLLTRCPVATDHHPAATATR